MLSKYNFDAKIIFRAVDKRLMIMCLQVNRKKYEKNCFASLKSIKKGVGSGCGSVSKRSGSGSAPTCPGSLTLVPTGLVVTVVSLFQ
jgi:hypothetical protein